MRNLVDNFLLNVLIGFVTLASDKNACNFLGNAIFQATEIKHQTLIIFHNHEIILSNYTRAFIFL